MGGTPVTLDFSQSQPIQPAGGVSLDFSKAQRIASSPIAPPPLSAAPGAPSKQPMEKSLLGNDEEHFPTSGGKKDQHIPGSFEGSYSTGDEDYGAAMTGMGAATGAALAAPAVIPPIARFAAKHPILSMGALEVAKKIPYVGGIARHIPTWAPLMMGGKGEPTEPAPSGDIGEAPIEGEYVDSPEPSIAKPSGPPFADAEEINVHESPPPAPYRKVGGIEPEDVGPPDANILAHRGGIRIARPDNRGLALPPKPLNYPPAEPSGPYDGPIPAAPRGIHDTLDDQAVREEVNDAIGRSDRKWQAEDRADRDARNSPAMSKGMLTGQVDEHGIPLQPVKLTKTPGARAIALPKSRATIAKPGPTSDDDLTPILEKSLKEARIARAKK
jgi:hypothetical protein